MCHGKNSKPYVVHEVKGDKIKALELDHSEETFLGSSKIILSVWNGYILHIILRTVSSQTTCFYLVERFNNPSCERGIRTEGLGGEWRGGR